MRSPPADKVNLWPEQAADLEGLGEGNGTRWGMQRGEDGPDMQGADMPSTHVISSSAEPLPNQVFPPLDPFPVCLVVC